MTDIDWDKREIKVYERTKFFEGAGYRYSYLTLPGKNCQDIIEALKEEVIDNQTKIMAVEMNGGVYSDILGWFAHNWRGVKPELIHAKLHEVRQLPELDLVFLDYLGNPTCDDAVWIRNSLANALMPGAHLGMTVSRAFRNNRFIGESIEYLTHTSLYRDAFYEIREAYSYPEEMMPFVTSYYMLFKYYFFQNHGYEIDIHWYENGSPHVMLLFRLLNMRRVERHWKEDEIVVQRRLITIASRGRHESIGFNMTSIPLRKKETTMTTTTPKTAPEIDGNTVVQAIIDSRKNPTPGKKMKATKLLNGFVAQQVGRGKDAKWVKAGINARVTRVMNGNA